MMITYNVAVYF